MSLTEILLILVVALVVFGPKRLPEIAQLLGKCLGTFSRLVNDASKAVLNNTSDAESKIKDTSKDKE